MHILLMVVIGLVVLGAFVLGARALSRGRGAYGAWLFLWVWLVASMINAAIGYFRVGVPLLTEVGAFIPIFGIPAAAAWYFARRLNDGER
jgi:hypothetical protein